MPETKIKVSSATAQKPAQPANSSVLQLKKGELLFAEGDRTRVMYLLQSGAIRLFIKKGNSNVEVATIKPGEIIGEMAFLDGNPRSVSGEALIDSELTEISIPVFMQVIKSTPEWLKLLLRTIVGRLRNANARIRQLEEANTATSYTDKDGGKKSTFYQYLSNADFMKIAVTLGMLGARIGKQTEAGIEIDPLVFNMYCLQIMQIATAKVTSALEVLKECELVAFGANKDGSEFLRITAQDGLDLTIDALVEEDKKDPTARKDASGKGLKMMLAITAGLPKFEADKRTGKAMVKFAEITSAMAQDPGAKEPFKDEDLGELLKLGYIADLKIKPPSDTTFVVIAPDFVRTTRAVRALKALKNLNEQKREVAGIAK